MYDASVFCARVAGAGMDAYLLGRVLEFIPHCEYDAFDLGNAFAVEDEVDGHLNTTTPTSWLHIKIKYIYSGYMYSK